MCLFEFGISTSSGSLKQLMSILPVMTVFEDLIISECLMALLFLIAPLPQFPVVSVAIGDRAPHNCTEGNT